MGGKVDNEEKRELVTKVCLFFGFVAGAFFLALAITTFIIWRWPRMLENGGLQYLILWLAALTTAVFAFAFACLSKWLGQWVYKRDQQKQIRQLRQRKYESDTLFQVWKAVNLFLPRLLKWEEEGKGYPCASSSCQCCSSNCERFLKRSQSRCDGTYFENNCA